MRICDATREHLPAITGIYNDAVENTRAIWNDVVVDESNRAAWLAERERLGYPVLVLVDDSDDVMGYASFGDWRMLDGFRHTVEHSVYVRSGQHGRGYGRALMRELIDRATQIGKHVMVAAIESENRGSIALHESLGFEQVGRMPQVGTKFGVWLDLVFMQLILDDRTDPDGLID